MVGLGVLAAAAYTLWWRVVDADRDADDLAWETPLPLRPSASTGPAAAVAADGDGLAPWVAATGPACPASHPIKAKLASGIYHRPGGASYDRTVPDRCYRDPAAAAADGLRAAKR